MAARTALLVLLSLAAAGAAPPPLQPVLPRERDVGALRHRLEAPPETVGPCGCHGQPCPEGYFCAQRFNMIEGNCSAEDCKFEKCDVSETGCYCMADARHPCPNTEECAPCPGGELPTSRSRSQSAGQAVAAAPRASAPRLLWWLLALTCALWESAEGLERPPPPWGRCKAEGPTCPQGYACAVSLEHQAECGPEANCTVPTCSQGAELCRCVDLAVVAAASQPQAAQAAAPPPPRRLLLQRGAGGAAE